LEPHLSLAIWTAPPSHDVLQVALEEVAPETVYLFLVDPGIDSLDAFLRRLAGLVKPALGDTGSAAGTTSVSELAAATAQREATVRAGLAWLEARGVLIVHNDDGEEGDQLHLAPGDGQERDTLPAAAGRLRAHLQESAGYRSHSLRASAEQVIAPASD
jgi:hypothetical protein